MSESAASDPFAGAGERISALLTRRGWSKADLARRADVSRQTVHEALNDRLSIRTAMKLAVALQVPLGMIVPKGGSMLGQMGDDPPGGDHARRVREILLGADDDDVRPPDEPSTSAGRELEGFVSEMDRLVRTLSTQSAGELPVEAKIAILNGFEEAARLAGRKLPPEYWEIRRGILDKAAEGSADGSATEPR